MTRLGLRRRRKDRLRQAIGFAQPRRKRDPTNPSILSIILPAGSGDVSARNAFDVDHFRAMHQHRPPFQLIAIGMELAGIVVNVGGYEMIWNDVAYQPQPKERELRKHPALVGNWRRQDI